MSAAIWDMDGTLVDSGGAHFAAWRDIMAELGVNFTREIFLACFGMDNHTMLAEFLGLRLPREREIAVAERKEAHFRDLVPELVKLMPGARALLDGLAAAGWRQAVASSAPKANVTCTIDALGLGDYFGVMLGGDDVGRGKPAPDLFLRAAEMLAVEAGRCVVLEDSVHGIEAAHAAGMACLALTGTRSAADLAGAERVVDSLVSVSVGDMAALL